MSKASQTRYRPVRRHEAGTQDTRSFVARHKVLTVCGFGLLVVLALGAWAAWNAYTLAGNLRQLAAMTDTLKGDVRQGDLTALAKDISTAHRHAVAAYNAASDPTVRVAEAIPGLGDDLRATREVTRVARDITAATATFTSLIARVDNNRILDDAGRIDLSLVDTVGTSIAELSTAASLGSSRLATVDTSDLLPQIAGPVGILTDLLERVPGIVDVAEPYLQLVPLLLGQDQARTWFVIMQNLDEARPSGGLLASWLVLRAENGNVEILDQGTNDSLTAAGDVDYSNAIDAGYRHFWGSNLSGWLSMNLSANFPDNARLMRDAWNATHETKVDGVATFGQGMLPYLAAAIGPVQAGERTIAPGELEDYLRVGVYRDYPDPVAKDATVASLMMQVFTKLMAGELNLDSFIDTVTGHRSNDYVQVWAADPKTQQRIAAAGLAGEFAPEEGPVSSVRLVNAAGNKLDTFMSLDVTYTLGACEADPEFGLDWRTGTLSVALTNAAPGGLPPYMTGRLDLAAVGSDAAGAGQVVVGSNRDFVVVYAPVGATIEYSELDGQPASAREGELGGRAVAVIDVETMPGQTRTLKVTWSEPAVDDAGRPLTTTPRVVLPPLANPAKVTASDGAECA
jgi:hypothetical protein